MKLLSTILMLIGLSSFAMAEDYWAVAKGTIDGKPMIYKFMNKLPSEERTKKLPWLTIISWKYDGSRNNGLPEKDINQKMIKLEDALDAMKGSNDIHLEVYTITGSNLKEFAFYSKSRTAFTKVLNEALSGHERYPIEISFYEDKGWMDFSDLLSRYNGK